MLTYSYHRLPLRDFLSSTMLADLVFSAPMWIRCVFFGGLIGGAVGIAGTVVGLTALYFGV